MALYWPVLAKLGVIPPEAWDAIIPHGHRAGLRAAGALSRPGDEVSLNPQPLPPREVTAGASLLASLAQRAIIVVGGRGPEAFLADIDDWCGTGWPRPWPRPRWARDWDHGAVFAGAAAAAAELAAGYDHAPELQEVFVRAAEQLGERAMG